MKPGTTSTHQLQVLLLAWIGALVLHGLGLSYLQLQRNKKTFPEDLHSRDNTPELLQFSRQPAQQVSLDLVPVPQARILPPPRVPLPAKTKNMKGNLQGRVAPKARVKSAKRSSLVTAQKLVKASSTDFPKDFAKAVEALSLFRRSSDPHLQDQVGGESTILRSLLPEQIDAYNKIWAMARPQSSGWEGNLRDPLAAKSIEVRSISLQEAENKDLAMRHKLYIVLNDRVALFWLEGQNVWILQSSHPPLGTPESGRGSSG